MADDPITREQLCFFIRKHFFLLLAVVLLSLSLLSCEVASGIEKNPQNEFSRTIWAIVTVAELIGAILSFLIALVFYFARTYKEGGHRF